MRLVARIALVAVLLACACSKRDNAKPRMSCDIAVKQGVAAISERARVVVTSGELTADQHQLLAERGERITQSVARVEAKLTSDCVDKRWPQATLDCVANAKAVDELRACNVALPPEAEWLTPNRE